MTFEKRLANFFKLDDESWLRHANPWSVYTRYSVLPLLALAVWSRTWIDWWSTIPVILVLLWTFLNPRLFNKPKSTKNWASKAVFGERVYMNRESEQIPAIHRTGLIKFLNLISSLGLLLVIIGIIFYWFSLVILGVTFSYLGKSWFLDRMVWLYEDMKAKVPEYQSWEY